MCLHAKAYTSKSAYFVLGVCRRLLVWAPLAIPGLTWENILMARLLEWAVPEDPAGVLRAKGPRRLQTLLSVDVWHNWHNRR
jgi:hypothetical protein